MIVSSLVLIGYTAIHAGAHIPQDTVIITPLRHNPDFMIELVGVDEWANAYDGIVVSENVIVQLVESRTAVGFAQMSVVSADYFRMVHLPFVYGNAPIADSEYVVVLCTNMAWELFGTVDILGMTVQIAGDEYTVSGVVKASVTSPIPTNGFAWIPGFETEIASVLYISPDEYNLLSAGLDGRSLLTYLNHSLDNFFITDANMYMQSIALRGQLLLVLCVPGFLLAAVMWLIRLFRTAKSRTAYIIASFCSLLTLAVTAYFAWTTASIDLWLPAYFGEGLSGYRHLVFNTRVFANNIYLPMHLATLADLNFKANVAFAAGLFGLFVVGITKFLMRSKDEEYGCEEG